MKTNPLFKFAAFLLVCCALFGCKPEETEKFGTIYGTVTDFSSGDPISNANVRLNPRGETTLTGSDGAFQFNDLPSGSYSLSLSKNGYVDLDDDYVINIENGNSVQRAIQMQKQFASLLLVDNDGNTITMLDFGADEGVTQKTFSIFNNGNVTLDYTIVKTSDWIDQVVPSSGTIGIGDTKPFYVIIKRELLADGENNSNLLVTTTTSGGAELAIKAIKPVLPTVKTEEISNVTSNSAKCAGKVVLNGGMPVTDKGICYSKSENPTITDPHVSGGSGNEAYTCALTGLEKNTTYYVRAYATNSVGTAYGEQKSFKTASTPTVTTGNVTNVSIHNATCSGNVVSDGGYSVTSRGICWSTTSNPTINNNVVESGSGMGSFSVELTELNNNTTYYVRAFAKNSVGISYGSEVSFKTDAFGTFNYGGSTYYWHFVDINMAWSEANSYCNNLSINGLSGWRLPTKEELAQLLTDNPSASNGYPAWSSNSASYGGHYFVVFEDGIYIDNSYYYDEIEIYLIAIRKKN